MQCHLTGIIVNIVKTILFTTRWVIAHAFMITIFFQIFWNLATEMILLFYRIMLKRLKDIPMHMSAKVGSHFGLTSSMTHLPKKFLVYLKMTIVG